MTENPAFACVNALYSAQVGYPTWFAPVWFETKRMSLMATPWVHDIRDAVNDALDRGATIAEAEQLVDQMLQEQVTTHG